MIDTAWEGRTKVYIPTCDICGAQLTAQYSWQDAVDAKRIYGWHSKKIDGEWIDTCLDCHLNIQANSPFRREEE